MSEGGDRQAERLALAAGYFMIAVGIIVGAIVIADALSANRRPSDSYGPGSASSATQERP